MKVFLFVLVFAMGSALAGESVVKSCSIVRERQDTTIRYIPRSVVLGIQEKAMTDFPGAPGHQVAAVSEGIEAYFELQRVPNNPLKRKAAADFPYNFPKQLYLAQRGL